MVDIRPLSADDFEDWLPLWDGNNLGQRNENVTKSTWSELTSPESAIVGLGAWTEGKLAGIIHGVVHPTTGSLKPVCYMQDVYVDPASRRQGIAKALIAALEETGKREGWARIYWLAEGKNSDAQALYRSVGYRLDFSFHVLPL